MTATSGRPASETSVHFLFKSDILKHVFDKATSAVLLVALLPVIALTAAIVWLTLGSPVMFSQRRVALGMREIAVSKFRTMSDGRAADGTLLPDAERQTAVTKVLRRFRFDELPQLLAILRGDMSFVGPRPLPKATLAAFGALARIRCTVAPGMTGWAQVNGNTRLTNEEKIALDIWYVDHKSLLLDCHILILTLKTLILGEHVHVTRLRVAEEHLKNRPPVPPFATPEF
jgi:lipopolysaccharide/colanic/teichoic acid biosynthesis glycosyltransferase